MHHIIYSHRPLWQIQLLVGVAVALSGQIYLSPMDNSTLRLSLAVVLFPILLLILLKDRRTLATGALTAAVVVVFRSLLDFWGGIPLGEAITAALPGGLYYLGYAALFCLLRWRKSTDLIPLFPTLFLCDFLANLAELALSVSLHLSPLPQWSQLLPLVGAATLRAVLAVLILWWLGYCRKLLIQEEHEERYQRLFLMTAQMKNEVYLLENATERIETIMSSAYQLYEALEREADIPPPLPSLALSITRDIHEVKKDSLRVLRGLESGLDGLYDRETLRFSDLLHILVESTYHLTSRDRITLTQHIQQDFSTAEHYKLASILRNLVTNAMEAILSTDQTGHIRILQQTEGTNFLFRVEDDGPGMGERAKQNIFQMGYSTKFNPVTGDMNRGVGLCTVQALVSDLGGTISVESELGRGTTFTIIIPRKSLEGV